MTRTISVIGVLVGAALVLAPAAASDPWFQDRQEPARVSPDLVDRAAATQQRHVTTTLDARERSLSERPQVTSAVEIRERSQVAKLVAALVSGNSPDLVQPTVTTRSRTIVEPVRDDRFTLVPTTMPAPVAVAAGDDAEWPHVALGIVIGLLLAAGLSLATSIHIQPLAQ